MRNAINNKEQSEKKLIDYCHSHKRNQGNGRPAKDSGRSTKKLVIYPGEKPCRILKGPQGSCKDKILNGSLRISPQILTGSCKKTILQGSLARWSLVPMILSFKDCCKIPYRILQGNNPSRIMEILARILGRMSLVPRILILQESIQKFLRNLSISLTNSLDILLRILAG